MTFTLDLTPEEIQRIELARARGFDVEAMIRGVIAGLPATPQEGAPVTVDTTAELFAQWAEEDATEDEAELARRGEEWEELKAGLNANRDANGERPLFP